MTRCLALRVGCLILLLGCAGSSQAQQPATIHVLLLNGNDGKPFKIGNTGQAQVDSTGTPVTHEVADQKYATTQTSYQFTGKLTYLINENHTIALAVYGNPTKNSGVPNGIGGSNEGNAVFDESYGSTDISARYAGKLFNKQMLVEASVGYHHQQGSNGNPTI